MLSRFYYPAPWPNTHSFTLPDEVFRHAVVVLRMRSGDVCELFDGAGYSATIEITAIDKKSAQARWLTQAERHVDNESPLNLTLIQCLSSAEKMDWTIEKSVELGVNAIVPVFSNRSQIKLSAERIDKKILHWQRIIIAACAQSGRNICPQLHAPLSLIEWLKSRKSTVDSYKIILHPDPQLPQTLSQLPRPEKNTPIELLIGPESGFDSTEIHAAQQSGYQTALLGPRILRTETAGLATLSSIQALWGDF